ncbi:O-antigen ligase family protein, partial [Vibrio cholerae]|nr:O-antigen ligase family protein [Vibrio cholerae]
YMKINVRWSVFLLLTSLVVLSPLLTVLSYRFGFFVGGYKEIIQISLTLIVFYYLIEKIRLKISWPITLVACFSLYCLFHFIGWRDIGLIFDGFRFQVIYMISCSLLLISSISCRNNDVDVFIKSLFYSGFPVLSIGLIELFDPKIISILYGVDKSSMSNVTLAIGDRLISTLGNPINLGIYMCFFICSSYFLAKKADVFYYWIIFWILFGLTSLVIFFTLSRLAFLTLIILFLYIGIDGWRSRNKTTLSVISILVLLIFPKLLSVLLSNSDIFSRFYDMLELTTFSENSRISNWEVALKNLDSFIKMIWGLGIGASNPTSGSGGILVENSLLTILIEFGLIGLTMYISIVFSMYFRANDSHFFEKEYSVFFNMFLITFFVMSIGNDVNRNFPFVFYFWSVVFLIFKKECRSKEK